MPDTVPSRERAALPSRTDQESTCVARAVSDRMVCLACDLSWDRSDPERPPCNRKDRLPGGDEKLSPAEIRALRMAEAEWLNRRRGGYVGHSGGIRVRLATAHRLLGLKMLLVGPRGGLRTTWQGRRWLQAYADNKGAQRNG